jgi:hypothetical protein
MDKLTEDFVRPLVRRYHQLYEEGFDIFKAMDITLREANIPQDSKGVVCFAIRNFRSDNSAPKKTKVIPISVKLARVRRTHSEMSLPNGDRD